MDYKSLFIAVTTLSMSMCKVGADGTILAIVPNAGTLGLTVSTIEDERYQLQCSTNLISGIWEDIDDPFYGAGASTNLVVSGNLDTCWFRVVEEPSVPKEPDGPPGSPPPPPPNS